MIQATNNRRRPRVLLLAYACCPGKGSEAGLGWNRAIEIAKHCDTWVISEEQESAADVRRYLKEHGNIPGLHFEFVSDKAHERFMWRLPGLGYLSLNLWQRRAFRVAQRLHERIHFDLVHQVNFCGYREPGYLWKLDAPFVWGPFGGTQNFPWRFLGRAGFGAAIGEATRSVLNTIQLRFSPRVRRAARKANALLTANSTNQCNFARVHHVTPSLLAETGIPSRANPRQRNGRGDEKLRILWAGTLTTRKALDLLIEALATLPRNIPYELRVLGEGPSKNRWQRLARRLGVERNITWIGHEPLEEHVRRYAWADVFVFTSLRDTTGTVVLEALGAGVPVICLDHQGVRDAVTDDCGIKIPVTNPREVIARLSEAIMLLARDTAERERLGRGAVQRAKHYLWSRQAEEIVAVYNRVLENRSELPTHARREGASG